MTQSPITTPEDASIDVLEEPFHQKRSACRKHSTTTYNREEEKALLEALLRSTNSSEMICKMESFSS
jgi:hypothetical protein